MYMCICVLTMYYICLMYAYRYIHIYIYIHITVQDGHVPARSALHVREQHRGPPHLSIYLSISLYIYKERDRQIDR